MGSEARLKIVIDALNQAKGEIGNLEKDLKGAESATKRASGGFNLLKGSLTEISSGIGIAKEVWAAYNTALDATIGETVSYAAQVRELSRTIGATAEQASMLIQAADDVGVSAQSVQGALEAAIRKGVSPTIDGIAELATEYRAIRDPIRQTEFLFDKFGRSGADLAPLMKLGAQGIREAGEAARETGQVLSQEAVDSARKYEIALDDLGDRVEGLKIKLSVGLLPAVTSVVDRQTNAITTLQLLQQGYSTGKLSVGDYARALGNMAEAGAIGAFTGENLATTVDALNAKLKEAKPVIEEIDRLYPREIDYGLRWAASLKTQTDSTQDLKIAQDALKNSMATLSLEMAGPISKEMDSYNEKQADLAENAAKIKAELEKLQKTQGAVAKSETKNVMSATELALAQAKVTAATEDLNSITRKASKTKGEAGETDAEFALRVAQLKNEISDQTDKMGKANQSVTSYVNNSKKIAELKGEYDEVNLAISKNAQAHDDATKRILFDLLSQRAAMDGLSSDEMKALNDIALQWGLVDKKTHDAVTGIDSALAGLATSGNIDAFIGKIGGIEAAAQNANAAFQAMMSQQAGLHAGMGGSPVAAPAGLSTPSGPIPQAGGGDWIVNRPTLFLAGERDPERATFTPLRGGSNVQYNTTHRAGDTIVIDDHRTGALFLEMQRRERQRAAARSMG